MRNDKSNRLTWCTINAEEQAKCMNLSAAVNRDKAKFGLNDFMELICYQVNNYVSSKKKMFSEFILGL